MKETAYLKSCCVLTATLIISLSLSSCEQDPGQKNHVTGTGDLVAKTVEVISFNRFRLAGAANVYIAIGDEQNVVLKAQQEILNVMTYEVRSEELTVSFQENVSINTDKDIIVEITVPQIKQIAVDGTGLFELSGETQNELTIRVNGTGNINAYEMTVENCQIIISGTANCYVRVNTSLDVTVSGVGYIFYKGDPEIISSISGVGSIIDDN